MQSCCHLLIRLIRLLILFICLICLRLYVSSVVIVDFGRVGLTALSEPLCKLNFSTEPVPFLHQVLVAVKK